MVSAFDRGFLYGDGLFETMRVANGAPFRWKQHWHRLNCGAKFLGIRLTFSETELRKAADRLVAENALSESLLRLSVSRGVGPRGYSPKGADHPTTVISLHPAPKINPAEPPKWRLLTSTPRLPANEAVAQYKTSNKLAQVLARSEADAAGAQEGLLTNTDGFVVEGASSNLFWIKDGSVCTPPLVSGILAGVTRAVVEELCQNLRLPFLQANVTPEELHKTDAIFLSLSSVGIAQAITLDSHALALSPTVKQLSLAYWRKVEEETKSAFA